MNLNLGKAIDVVLDRMVDWGETAVRNVPNMLVAVFCLLLFWLLAIVVARLVHRVVSRLSIYHHVAGLMTNLSRLVVIMGGVLLALYALNLDRAVASMLAGIGIITVVIGFAAKNTGGDYLAGFIIHFTHPFRIGHLIQSGKFMGYVDSIELRATKIRTQQGQRVIIPNHKIMEEELTNYTITGERRVDVKCGVAQDVDLEKAEEVAVKAVKSLETRKKERTVELFYDEIADYSINFTIRFWTDPDQAVYLMAQSQAIKAIQQSFIDNGIKLSSPVSILDFSAAEGGTLREQLQGIRGFYDPRKERPKKKGGGEQKEKKGLAEKGNVAL